MGQILEKIVFKKEDFNHLKIQNPILSDENLTSIARSNSTKINDWIEIFLRGKKQETSKNTIKILRRLLEGAKPPLEFQEVRSKDLKNDLVYLRKCGGQTRHERKSLRKIRNELVSDKIKWPQTLFNILEKLVNAKIVIKIQRVEPTLRSSPDKKKENTYYQINNEIFFLQVKPYTQGKSPDKRKKLEEKNDSIYACFVAEKDYEKKIELLREKMKINNELMRRDFDNTSKEFYFAKYLKSENDGIQYHEMADQFRFERDIAIELLKERGLSDPKNTIRQLIEESGILDS